MRFRCSDELGEGRWIYVAAAHDDGDASPFDVDLAGQQPSDGGCAAELHDGFLAQKDATSILLRQPNTDPLLVPLAQVKHAEFLDRSLMPEGLLEGLPETDARDLLAYLRSLK